MHPVGYHEARQSWCCLLPTLVLACVAGCVPADQALPLGSAEFTVTGRASPRLFVGGEQVVDGWSIRIDRFVVSFKTMTIVNLLNSDQCAYRGRGAASNVVFEATEGSVVQAFNGIKPGACPDVGMRLGAPDDRTVLGEGATVADLVALATGQPALALVEATATFEPSSGDTSSGDAPPVKPMHISMRFDALTTSAAFGGCRDASKGARIRPESRYALFVSFALENLFRDAISATASLRFAPFALADSQYGNKDGIVTMDEIDKVPLALIPFEVPLFGSQFYQLPDGTTHGSFGDYLRKQFQFSLKFGNGGQCNGIDPGTEGL